MTFDGEHDVIVAGGGSAGCVVAARLTENPGLDVLLLEAGPPDKDPWIHIPMGFGKLVPDPGHNWGYMTEPEPHLDNRQVTWPRGKVLGGSGSINGLVFMRGAPTDFDEWERLGAKGWAYKDVLPYFKKLETNSRGGSDLRGGGGPMSVTDIAKPSAAARAWVEACTQLQHPFNADFNGEKVDGVGFCQLNTRDGRRCSTAVAYLHPVRHRRNLHVMTGTRVMRVLFEGKRAIGVEIERNGRIERLKARRHVVVSGGAINSPQLLLASGVGPAAELKAMGIDVRHDLPGVGKNLQDHVMVRLSFRSTRTGTLNDIVRNPLRALGVGLEYMFRRTGQLTVGAVEGVMFARTSPSEPVPDLEFQCVNFSLDTYQQGLHPHPGFMFNFFVCRPDSRGEIKLRDPEGREAPRIFANYFSDERDVTRMVRGFRMSRQIIGTEPFKSFVAEELRPGPACETDDEFKAYLRQAAATVYHPCGTCTMGTDAKAVVGPDLSVRGLEALSVIDASVMPMVPSSNIHPATIMLAERGAEMLGQRLR